MKYTKPTVAPYIKIFFQISSIFLLLLILEMIYINYSSKVSHQSLENKMSIVKIISLPDLAISSDSLYLRHRSYANIFDRLSSDGELQANSKMSFVY
ncbi:MAG: hypothetical protein HY307_02845 [Arcobacter sp.]|nr:hypothetical protein [Arcobacter sp.]